jgi:hypothetical protein
MHLRYQGLKGCARGSGIVDLSLSSTTLKRPCVTARVHVHMGAAALEIREATGQTNRLTQENGIGIEALLSKSHAIPCSLTKWTLVVTVSDTRRLTIPCNVRIC